MRSFGDMIKSQRQELGLTQKQVAESIGVSDAYICSLENGKRCPPPYPTVAIIGEALELNAERLWKAAVKHREKQAVKKSQRKALTRRKSDDADDEAQQRQVVPDSEINAFFERAEIQMAVIGIFQKQPAVMSMEEKRIVFQAIIEAQESVSEQIG